MPLGVIAAVKQRTPADWGISSAISLGLAVPNFWLGILLILLFAVALGWLPPGGHGDFMRDPLTALKFLALPAFTLALPQAMNLSRLTKASVLEVLYEDYVRTARAKGLANAAVINGHVLRNALVPIVTAIGLEFGRLLGGAIIVESVFAWPGLGTLMLSAVGNRDYVIVQACLLLLVTVFIVVNLLADISYGFLDPRIRLAADGAASAWPPTSPVPRVLAPGEVDLPVCARRRHAPPARPLQALRRTVSQPDGSVRHRGRVAAGDLRRSPRR